MARPATEKKPARSLKAGTVIRLPRNGPDGVVKAISVVFHMENGQDVVYSEEDDVSVLVDQPK